MTNIITGEKIQQLCDIYLGVDNDFNCNPTISKQPSKHVYLNNIINLYDNPQIVFCYSHRINILSEKIKFFKNDFILVTHNSDGEIRETLDVINILNCDKVLKWFGQNILFNHEKLYFLPIGMANSQWSHGNIAIFNDIHFMNNLKDKHNKVYFNFNIHTNKSKRQICYDNLYNKLTWLPNIQPIDNLKRLSSYEFCICPEGNGVDTHRLWECLYLQVIPIVIKSEFTSILLNQHIPLVVLDNWEMLDLNKLNYNKFEFNTPYLNNLLCFRSTLCK